MQDALVSLGILFFFAIVGGVIATRFKLPAVLGLLLVGSLIGPNMLNLVNDLSMITLMAEFGAILLLFVIGIEFDLTKLAKIGFKAISVGILKDGIVFFIGFQTALLLGFDAVVGMFVGIILAFSSTVVIVKILEQKELTTRQEVPLLMAVLIIEDILAVLAITFLSGIGTASTGLVDVMEQLTISLLLLVLAYVAMLKIARPLIGWLMKNSGDEVITFVALGMCAGFSYLAHALGITPTAGAFLAGSIMASLPNAKTFEHAISPYTLTFTSLFFIAIGTLVNFSVIKENLFIIEVLIAAVLISRFVAVGIVTRIFANFKGDQVFFSSIAMFSVGEFALLVAKESLNYHLSIDLVSISSAIIFISALIMAFTVNHSAKMSLPWKKIAPQAITDKLDMLATYIKSFFDEIDNENSTTKLFKKSAGRAFLFLVLLVFVFVLYRQAIGHYYLIEGFAKDFTIGSVALVMMMIQLVCFVLAVFFAGLFAKHVRTSYSTLSSLLSNLDANRNLQKSSFILRRLSFGAVFLFLGFLVPVLLFLFRLNLLYNILSFVFMFLCIYEIARAIKVIKTHHTMDTGSFRRMSLDNYKLKVR